MTERRTAFIDCETTGLDPETRQAWEVAVIIRDPAEAYDLEHHWFVDATWLDWEHADREALAVGGFDERYDRDWNHPPNVVLDEVFVELADATVVGSNPWFDLHTLRQMSARFFTDETDWAAHEPWHYRAVDVTSMAMPVLGLTHPLGLEKTAEALGVDLVGRRLHTAAGDARLTRDVYDAVLKAGVP